MSVVILARDRRVAVRMCDGRCRVVDRDRAAELLAAGRADLLPRRWLRAWDVRCRLAALDRRMAGRRAAMTHRRA
jgi:hypothetical protein